MDIFGGVSFEAIDSDIESVLFDVVDTTTGERIDNMKNAVVCRESNGEIDVYFGRRLVPFKQCEVFMMEYKQNDDWERNIMNKVPDESVWSKYTPFRRIVFKFLKDKYKESGTMYCNDESWRKIRSTFTELSAEGLDTSDLTMSRLESFLEEISVDVSDFFKSVGTISRYLFSWDSLCGADAVEDTTEAFEGIDYLNKKGEYHLLTSILIKALYGNVQYRVDKIQIRRLRSILLKLPKDKDITITRFKAVLEMFNIKYTDVFANIEKFKEE